MTFTQGIIIGLLPVGLTWIGSMVWLIISDHTKHKGHDDRMLELRERFGRLESRVERLEARVE